MRVITGTHSAASEDFLHGDLLLLPVEAHHHLTACQFYAKTLDPAHPSHEIATLDPEPRHRRMKETLRSKCHPTVEPFLVNGGLPPGGVKELQSKVHTKIVSDTIDALGPNRVLGVRPPLLSKHEKHLPKPTRSTLAQLRSGHCVRLKDYQFRLGKADDELCPECGQEPQTSSHLFNCPTHPTNLTASDLWEKPWDVAVHLSSLQSFNHLPDPGPPPPPPPQPRCRNRPPPEPPPSPASISSISSLSTPNSSILDEFSSISLPETPP